MSEDHSNGGSDVLLPLAEVNIHDVIRDRKGERRVQAEEKREADLQRIRDMRSTTGIDPLQQFPKEIWNKIFDELDSEDRGNVWHVHPLFRDLLESTRVRDLFLEVLKVDAFLNKIYCYFGSRYNGQLRLISKATRNSFDQWKELRLAEDIQEMQADSSSYDDLVVNVCLSNTNERDIMKRLLNSYVEEGGKCQRRFFPRALTVSFKEYDMVIGDDILEVFEQYKSDVFALLKAIGDQIWQFRFFVDLDTPAITFSFADLYILFQSWMTLMPNAKWLEVFIQPSCQMIDETNERFSVAQSAIRNHPFPRLSHLERLTFHSNYVSGKQGCDFLNIYEVILAANQHIKMLDITDEYLKYEFPSRRSPLFPAIQTQPLQLTRFTVCDEDYSVRYNVSCWQKIQPILNCNWPLKTICLALTADVSGESKTISPVLRFLQHFPTLEKVKLIRLEEFDVKDTEKIGYLKLPNLKEFEIELTTPKVYSESNVHFFFSLQFLLECKNLKKIAWELHGIEYLELREHLKKCEGQNRNKMVDFRGGLRYMYDSNIWKVFPSLDALNVCIRKQYDVYGGEKCEHEYLRKDIDGMSVRRFLNMHECSSSSRHLLGNCIVFVK